ncbi:hypothetical protein CBL_21448, partial [Carabus blaptoides fortunei]
MGVVMQVIKNHSAGAVCYNNSKEKSCHSGTQRCVLSYASRVFHTVPAGHFINKKTRQKYSYATRMLTDITLPSINGRFSAFVKNQQNSGGDQEISTPVVEVKHQEFRVLYAQIVISPTPILGSNPHSATA